MPLPVTLNDYLLINQMGYEVRFKNNKPIKVVKRKTLVNIVRIVFEYFSWYAIVTKYKLLITIGNIKQKDRKAKGART